MTIVNDFKPEFRMMNSKDKTKAQHDAIEKYSSLHYDPKSAEHKKWREEQDKRINKRMSSSEAVREEIENKNRKGMSHEDMEDVKGGRLGSFMKRRME